MKFVQSAYRAAQIHLRRSRMQSLAYPTHYLAEVSPDHIVKNYLKLKISEKPIDYILTVADGDWDNTTETFAKSMNPLNRTADVLEAFNLRILYGIRWTETNYYARLRSRIDRGESTFSCSTVADLGRRMEYLDKLWQSIERNGFNAKLSRDPLDQIQVHVSRDGSFLFCDGRHRLAIAKTLALNSVPVTICRRHLEWVGSGRHLPENVSHPDNVTFASA